MKEKILITGYNGSIAQKLNSILDKKRYEIFFLTTKKKKCSKNIFYWSLTEKYIDPTALKNVKHIIHLSGYNISNKWNSKNKEIMYDSRVKTSEILYKSCIKLNIKPKTFISASAMGYYGFNQSGEKNEKSKCGNDWMARLCDKWEQAADKFKVINCRVMKMRLSLIMDKNSGILQKINLGFKFRLGIVFGDGSQLFPWISIDDVTNFISYTIEEKTVRGTFNLASPHQHSYYDFIKMMQNLQYPNSLLVKIPKFIIELFLIQKKVLVFNNISLDTRKLQSTGFKFKSPTIAKLIDAQLQ